MAHLFSVCQCVPNESECERMFRILPYYWKRLKMFSGSIHALDKQYTGSIHALDKQYTGSIQAFTDLHVMCSPDEQNVIIFAIFFIYFLKVQIVWFQNCLGRMKASLLLLLVTPTLQQTCKTQITRSSETWNHSTTKYHI